MVKQRRRGAGGRRVGRPASSLERVKFFVRADPADVELFREARAALVEREGRRVTDAEVFRLAVRAYVAALPADQRVRVERSRG
jgi:hypothetical protein